MSQEDAIEEGKEFVCDEARRLSPDADLCVGDELGRLLLQAVQGGLYWAVGLCVARSTIGRPLEALAACTYATGRMETPHSLEPRAAPHSN